MQALQTELNGHTTKAEIFKVSKAHVFKSLSVHGDSTLYITEGSLDVMYWIT